MNHKLLAINLLSQENSCIK
jgi:hypothetical protein